MRAGRRIGRGDRGRAADLLVTSGASTVPLLAAAGVSNVPWKRLAGLARSSAASRAKFMVSRNDISSSMWRSSDVIPLSLRAMMCCRSSTSFTSSTHGDGYDCRGGMVSGFGAGGSCVEGSPACEHPCSAGCQHKLQRGVRPHRQHLCLARRWRQHAQAGRCPNIADVHCTSCSRNLVRHCSHQ